MNKLVNVKTGEVLEVGKSSPKLVSEALSDLIIKRKELETIERKVKAEIKKLDLKFEENTNGVMEANYGIARIRKSYREGFDSKKFEEVATDKEKLVLEMADKVKKKYIKLTEITTFY